jgi:hypothetical protein
VGDVPFAAAVAQRASTPTVVRGTTEPAQIQAADAFWDVSLYLVS